MEHFGSKTFLTLPLTFYRIPKKNLKVMWIILKVKIMSQYNALIGIIRIYVSNVLLPAKYPTPIISEE